MTIALAIRSIGSVCWAVRVRVVCGVMGGLIGLLGWLLGGQAELMAQSGDENRADAGQWIEVRLSETQRRILAQSADVESCVGAVTVAEQLENIPRNLLMAIATVESGLPVGLNDSLIPWPWTVRSGGVGYYYETRQEAEQAVEALLRHGVRNIDVGCMQINLLYHADAFSSIDEAFEPVNNVAYGAGFLMALRGRHGVWSETIARYHSSNEERQDRYRERIFEIWQMINRRDRQVLVASNQVALEQSRSEQRRSSEQREERQSVLRVQQEEARRRSELLNAGTPPNVNDYNSQRRLEVEARSRALTPLARVYRPLSEDPLASNQEGSTDGGPLDERQLNRVTVDRSFGDGNLAALEDWLLRKLDQQGGDTSFDLRDSSAEPRR